MSKVFYWEYQQDGYHTKMEYRTGIGGWQVVCTVPVQWSTRQEECGLQGVLARLKWFQLTQYIYTLTLIITNNLITLSDRENQMSFLK